MKSQTPTKGAARSQLAEFRQHFQRSMRRCLERGFSAEECFGILWEETCEQFDLDEAAHQKLYEEMVAWAKQWVK